MVGPRMRVAWAGDSMKKLSTFSAEAQLQIGQDLDRVQRGQEPLDSGSMVSTLPHVFELRDEDKDFWYRLFYIQIENKIYVLDCIKKKTTQTSQADMERSRGRLKAIKQELAEQAKEVKRAKKK
jgi:phage-related protein